LKYVIVYARCFEILKYIKIHCFNYLLLQGPDLAYLIKVHNCTNTVTGTKLNADQDSRSRQYVAKTTLFKKTDKMLDFDGNKATFKGTVSRDGG
jgi:hypothetical protein